MPVLLSYRNQSIDLHSKSIDRFLYEGNTGIQWVKNYFPKWCNGIYTDVNRFYLSKFFETLGKKPRLWFWTSYKKAIKFPAMWKISVNFNKNISGGVFLVT